MQNLLTALKLPSCVTGHCIEIQSNFLHPALKHRGAAPEILNWIRDSYGLSLSLTPDALDQVT